MCPVFERANLAQLVEHHLAKVDVEGSSPLVRSISYGGVAQLVEQVTLNHWVHGSSPCTPTIKKKESTLTGRFFCFYPLSSPSRSLRSLAVLSSRFRVLGFGF